MKTTAINPSTWSVGLGFDQAQLVEGPQRQLVCSAQDAVDANGQVQHPGDMAAQLEFSVDNLVEVLAGADMTLADVVRLNCYTTDMDALLEQFGVLSARFGGERFATSLVEVSRLPAPGLVVALEVTAMD